MSETLSCPPRHRSMWDWVAYFSPICSKPGSTATQDFSATAEATDEPQDSENITGANRPTFTYASRRLARYATIRRARSASMHCERRRWNWAGANP